MENHTKVPAPYNGQWAPAVEKHLLIPKDALEMNISLVIMKDMAVQIRAEFVLVTTCDSQTNMNIFLFISCPKQRHF